MAMVIIYTPAGKNAEAYETRLLSRSFDHFPPFIESAVRASLVGLLHFPAIWAFAERRRGQMVVRATLILAGLRMTPFWIRHKNTPRSLLRWD
jgi:hypothetical protein